MQKHWFWILGLAAILAFASTCNDEDYISVGFYNVENLFDTIDDPNTFDGEYLPDSFRNWNTNRYQTKLYNLSKVITAFGEDVAPDFLGLCEVENRKVVEDLISTEKLIGVGYKLVHIDSRDARGIDVAGLYRSAKFELIDFGIKRVDLSEFEQITRDILWVNLKSKSHGEDFYFIVNHWPSRRGGLAESEPKRKIAASVLKALKDSLIEANPLANVVIMGDFNDEPANASIDQTLGALASTENVSNSQVFNAMKPLDEKGRGSYCFRGNWNMLDQIMVNGQLLNGKGWEYKAKSATIHDWKWLRQRSGDYKNYPLRTFGGKTYLAGYSDHFPVSILLEHRGN